MVATKGAIKAYAIVVILWCGMIIPRIHRSPVRAEMFVGVWARIKVAVIRHALTTEDAWLQIGMTQVIAMYANGSAVVTDNVFMGMTR